MSPDPVKPDRPASPDPVSPHTVIPDGPESLTVAEGGLRDAVLATGTAAGLDAVGVCDAEPFEDTRRVLEERRDRGLAGGMQFTYRNPARSTDPGRALPGARSLVVGAMRYDQRPPPRPGRPAARVARYATTDHYQQLRDALEQVAHELRRAGHRAVVVADDNALVDRAAAVRAGLGWYGKSANVLIPRRGSWFVLGSVVTDAELGAGPEPVADGCGGCRRCLDGCPTGAIIDAGVVDARRCLAWLLQAPGSFPVEFREALGDRIYGCDDCQEVCPPSVRVDRAAPDAPRVPRAGDPGSWVDLCWLLQASDEELMGTLGRWYIPRREARYLRRNALVVAGNLLASRADEDLAAAVGSYLLSRDPLLAEHARWAVQRGTCVGR